MKYYLFGFIPLFANHRKGNTYKIKILGVPVLKIKQNTNKSKIKYYIFGLPLLKCQKYLNGATPFIHNKYSDETPKSSKEQALYPQRFSCQFKNKEWITYFESHDVESDLLKLKQNLSEDSQFLIDVFYSRRCAPYVLSAFEIKQHELVLTQDISKYKIINRTGFQPEVFYFKNGLKFIDDNIVKKHLRGKDIIDGGACSGDSALMFAEHKFINMIYSFEPMTESFDSLKKTFEANNCLNAQAVHKALSNQDGTMEILGQICQTTTVDTFAKDKKIGCIKFDLEGMETKALLGAEQTIKRDKPLLLICLYHTPEDFFGIKPIIESWNLGYKFKIADTEPCNTLIGMHLTLIDIRNK